MNSTCTHWSNYTANKVTHTDRKKYSRNLSKRDVKQCAQQIPGFILVIITKASSMHRKTKHTTNSS